ncbi:MAG: iron-containing alcohol dehydrogenase [Gammaproteobacteria bacterium]|nr:iron-containing alcohol dehydrogenase [Gammaproteobacteria bacterium]MCH9743477.1 iron-containing alcohol dehydrogenase [Gammaproteobacteria bacterium]
MSLLVCSKSTRKFFADMERIYMVQGAPQKEILKLASSEDMVIAVGGGAVIDTAKIISKGPIVCYPTTAAGSSATSWAVYWDGQKKCSYKAIAPGEIYFNESFLDGMPRQVLEYTTYDVVSHCLDSMWSKNATTESKQYVDQAIAMIKDRKNDIDLIKAGHIAGRAIEITSTSLLHCLSYPLTGIYGVPHGKALGFLLPKISKWMGNDVFEILGEFEVKIEEGVDISRVVEAALKYPKIYNSRKQLTKKILERVLTQ